MKAERLLFTITPGRSGTMLLANMCVLLPGVAAEHEPKPLFSDIFFKLRREPQIVYPFLKVKRKWIDRICAEEEATTYIETCHLACKGFFEPMLGMGWKFEAIILKRPLRDVATSLYRIGDVPTQTRTGRKYYLHPENPNNRVDITGYWKKLSAYQLCYWYCLEMERRSEYYRVWLPKQGVKVHEVGLEELGTMEGFKAFLSRVHLPEPPALKQKLFDMVTVIQWNYKATRKRCGPGTPVDPAAQEAELTELILRGENKCHK